VGKRILTIDDSKTIRDMLAFTLGRAGYEVIQAEDGRKGLEAVAGGTFDVIITDINMPVMDGIAFIREARALASCKATPILVLTTETSDEKKTQARAAGATGWIVKPFDPAKLLAVIDKVSP
jgi:two-component system chemotaxis response regulator CheY